MAESWRWLFEDTAGLEEPWTVPFNPSEADDPVLSRAISGGGTAHAGGTVFAVEGAGGPEQKTFSGTVLEREHYYGLRKWAGLKRRIRVTDHRGRKILAVPVGVEMTDVTSPNFPWRHEFVFTWLVLRTVEVPE